jgi:UDP-N-acetylglucosamine---dolichyl-phosphate N-acetylglucosaminyltransferase
MNSNNGVWVIIPAYNEEKRIKNVIEKVKKHVSNIVVVDDGSSDNTYDVSLSCGVYVLKHIINLGKGGAVKTGCEFVLEKNGKFVVLIDSDGQHDADEIPDFLEALESVDIVFGYRKFNETMPFVLKFGNGAINLVIKKLYGMDLRDTQSGYRAFRADVYEKIKWKANDYTIESEMIANVGKKHLKYKEIPIKTIYSDKYKGTTIFDGLKIVMNMILWKLKK